MGFVAVGVFWLLAIWGVLSRRPVLFYLFFSCMGFGAMAVVPPELTGGLTFIATPILTLLIVLRAFLSRSGPDFFLTSALRPNRLGLLFLFWVVAMLATLTMPRLFAGAVEVVPIRGILQETTPLMPTAQNISQLVYLTISVLGVFAFARILRSRGDRQHALKAMVFGGAVTGFTGMLDFATQFVPISFLLDPLRTATYSMATNVEVLGGKRVVGLMPEASSFGGLCLGLVSALIFYRRAIADVRVRNLYAPLVIGLLLICCWLAKSSGTYLGLSVLALVVGAEALLRGYSRGRTRALYRQDLIGELSLVFGLFVLVLVLFMIRPETMQPAFELIDRMVLQKSDSISYEERGMWRQVALDSIFSTYGFGVGLGGTRASSSMVAIFSSTGIIGGVLYYSFVLMTLLRRSAHMDWEGQFILAAFRFSFLPGFVVSLLVGGSDFGGLLAFGYGLVTATTFSTANVIARKRARQRRRKVLHASQRVPPDRLLPGAPEPRPMLPGRG